MKRFLFILSVLLFSLTNSNSGDHPGLNWLDIEKGIPKATREKKLIILDAYTDWCSWCKVMDEKTYTDPKVVEYMNQRYVAIKMDAESSTPFLYQTSQESGRTLSMKMGVQAYPTTLFLESNGDLITAVPGYLPPEDFIQIITFIGERYFEKMTWKEFQEKNKVKM
jgi:thioredoxin-related protein